jgi:hypothetical protein
MTPGLRQLPATAPVPAEIELGPSAPARHLEGNIFDPVKVFLVILERHICLAFCTTESALGKLGQSFK